MTHTTNTILLHALGTLWPKDEPKPSFRHHKGLEWECYNKDTGICCPTLEEALYRYVVLCQTFDSRFGPVLDFLEEFVDDPIIDEKERPRGPFVEMDEVVNQFLKP